MRRAAAAVFFLALFPCTVSAQVASSGPPITLPSDGDDYSRLVAKAAAHDTATDFRALRFAWLTSAARKRRSEIALMGVTSEMMTGARAGDAAVVRGKAAELLSSQYSSLLGQKMLRQACAALKDQACADQGQFVEFGMLESILKSGDGKTCATGWEVSLISEEYFILGMMGLRMQQQALINGANGGHSCDAMTATDEKGAAQTRYFIVDRVLADEMDMLGLKKP